jgi:uncharacterized repeat protein (TIGR03803 family)
MQRLHCSVYAALLGTAMTLMPAALVANKVSKTAQRPRNTAQTKGPSAVKPGTTPPAREKVAGRKYRQSKGKASSFPVNVVDLYDFAASSKDASSPYGAVILASDGNFYGTTFVGGAKGYGAIYQITSAGTYTLLYSFTGGDDGAEPYAGMIEASDGNLYGTTTVGGSGGSVDDGYGGTIFQYNLATKAVTTVYSFQQGGLAAGDLIDDGKGTLYGTAFYDGSTWDPSIPNGYGSVFSWNYTTSTFTTLYSFSGGADGGNPESGLVLATDGNLYGTARYGGAYDDTGYGDGTAFYISTDGTTFNAFYNFSNGIVQAGDGYGPAGDLVEYSDGNLYTIANAGGPENAGSFVQIVPAGSSSTLNAIYAFQADNDTDGANVFLGRPLIGGDGYFYLAGADGGYNGLGQLMQLDTTGDIADVYDFYSTEDNGAYFPYGGVYEYTDGNLYGATSSGGLNFGGIFYQAQTALPTAISMTASTNAVNIGSTVTLTWAVNNVYGKNATVCLARSTDGLFTGSLALTGSQVISPTTVGTQTYSITCGGVESAVATVVVSKITTSVAFTAVPSTLVYGQSAPISVTVTPGTGSGVPTGSVTLMAGTTTVGTLPLSGGSASATLNSKLFVPGTYQLTAVYSGDNTYATATSTPATLVIQQLSPTVTIGIHPSSVTQGTAGDVTVTVSNGGVTVPTGTVVLSSEGVYLATAFLSGGKATVSVNSLPYRTGTYTVTATYSGDTYNNTEVGTEQVTLTKANTLTQASGPSTVVRGSMVSIPVTVSRPNLSGTPSGTVYLEFRGNYYASATLTGGSATITADTTGLPLGSYSVEVKYAGDVNNNASTSAPFTITVTAD